MDHFGGCLRLGGEIMGDGGARETGGRAVLLGCLSPKYIRETWTWPVLGCCKEDGARGVRGLQGLRHHQAVECGWEGY